jgi:hypothetical protein
MRSRSVQSLGVAWAAIAVLSGGSGGCQRTRVAETLDASIAQGTDASDLEFWHSLSGRSAVTNNEGLHGVLVLSDGKDPTLTWDERLALLKERAWVVDGFDAPGDATIERGTLAKALCHALGIEGGVMMRLTHRAPRYALRELAFLRVMASTTDNQVVNGRDYLGIMGKAQDYAMLQETRRARAAGESPAVEPPPSAQPAELVEPPLADQPPS